MPRRRRKKDQINWASLTIFGGIFTFIGAAGGIIGQGYSLYSQVAQRQWVESELEKLERTVEGKIAVSESNVKAYSNNNRADFTRESDQEFARIRQNIAVMSERLDRLFEMVGRNKNWIDSQRHTKGR